MEDYFLYLKMNNISLDDNGFLRFSGLSWFSEHDVLFLQVITF